MGYSIGQVAKKTGLGVHTLRYYEKKDCCLLSVKAVPACGFIPTVTSAGWE